jgi:PAS domain S-box-containing protein
LGKEDTMNEHAEPERPEIEIYREMLDHLEDIVFCHDPEGRFLFMSAAAERLLGYRKEDLPGLDFAKTIPADYLEEARQRTERQRQKLPVAQPWELQVLSRQGERVWVQIRTQPLYDARGRLLRVYGIARDLRARKAVEEKLDLYTEQLENLVTQRTAKLRESEQRFRELAEMLPETVFEIDLTGRVTFVNRSAFGTFGYTPQDLEEGLIGFDLLSPEDRGRALANMAKVLKGEDLGLTEYTALTRSGERIPVLLHSAAILRDGQAVGIRGFMINIRERKQVELALRESEERNRRILETVPDWIAIARVEDGLFREVNEYFTRMMGYTREEVIGRTSIELGLFLQPADRVRIVESLRETGEVNNVEIRMRTKQGVVLDTLVSARRINFQGEDCMVSVVTDITGRKKAEQELIRLATVVEQAAEGILITESDGTISYANPAFSMLSGFSSAELVGRNIRTMKCDRHDDGFYRHIWSTVTAGNVWKGFIFHQAKEGTVKELESTLSPIRDSTGEVINFVSINRDATQERSLEAQLRQAQKLEAMGTLAGGIAHDFNNILSAIIGFTELAHLDATDQPGMQAQLQEVLKGAKRARDLVKQILTFSRQGQQERKPVDVRIILKEALRLLRATLPSTIEIRQTIGAGCGPVEADPTQIHQVLMNLCTNAAHAMREKGGVLEIELQPVQFGRPEIQRFPGLRSGFYLELTVKDSGHGIAPENLERIFDPYFTTKDKGEGTGLGLAVVQGIVKAHRGAIFAESRTGEGASFHVLLPVIEIEAAAEREPAAELKRGGERVLLVDDESDLVEMGRLMLERLGYSVAVRTSSIEALELFKSDPDRFQLVITDMTMPNMTGDQLAQKLLEIRPRLPVILCTGYSERMTEARAREMGIKAFVMKPVVMQDLSVTIRKVLENP